MFGEEIRILVIGGCRQICLVREGTSIRAKCLNDGLFGSIYVTRDTEIVSVALVTAAGLS